MPLMPRSPTLRIGQNLRGTAAIWIVPATAFLIVAGLGAAFSCLRVPPETIGPGGAISSQSGAAEDGKILARLDGYARSSGPEQRPPSAEGVGKPLPDVNTMIERLAARLKTSPDDIKGWRMLGWSYFNTGHFEKAAAAYAKATALDPNSAELKLSYEQAKAKADGLASPLHVGAAASGGDDPHAEKNGRPAAVPSIEQNTAVRAMVDGLASRLEQSPRDVEGWTRLMRSRVVLGEQAAALAALHTALDVFRGDQDATGTIEAAAIELGLKVE